MIKALVTWFSLLFHALLSLLLILIAGVALGSGIRAVRLEMLPWTGGTLVYVLLGGGLFGLVSLGLAMRRKLRVLFFLWALAVAILLINGYVFSRYRFVPGEWIRGLLLLVASMISAVGAWFQLVLPARYDPYRY